MNKRRWMIIGIVAIVIIGIIGFSVFNTSRAQQELLDSLQTVELSKGELVATIGATGIVRSYQSAMLSWETSGTGGAGSGRPWGCCGRRPGAGCAGARFTSAKCDPG